MGPIQTFQEFASWLRRRISLIALVGLLGVLAGLVAALSSDRVYTATAVLQVINPVVGADGESGAQRRVQMIEQRLMARDNLLSLSDRLGVFDDTQLRATERVAVLRQSIRIESIAAAPSRPGVVGGLSAIIITVNMSDPELVAAIANELAESVVEESAAAARDRAQQALGFYREEESRIEEAINTLETELAAFQMENEDLLPERMALRRDDLRRLEESRLDIERQLSHAQGERSVLEEDSSRALSRRRIAELDELIAQYERDHRLLGTLIEQTRAPFIQAPAVARQLGAFERRMEQLQTQLTTIAQQRRDAELGQRIETDEQSERIEVLEAAIAPDYAISRGRTRTVLLGAIAGLMAGFAVAFAVEAMNPVMRTAQRMERELQLRPVISIPLTASPREVFRRRLAWALGGGFIVLAALMALVLQLTSG